MDLWTILSDIVMLLAASLLFGGLFSRLGQSPIIGYLLAGMILGGPGSIHAVRSEKEIEAIAELGVALLLFSLGLEFSVDRMKQLGSKPLFGGGVQVVATAILGTACCALFDVSFRAAVAFGAMISLSSTAVVLRTLMERSELETPHGRNSVAVLLTQDMAVVPLALLMTLLAGGGGAKDVVVDVLKLIGMAAGLILGLMVLNLIAVRALGMLTLLRNRELTVIFAVVTGLGSAWGAHAAGVSPALGAFVAGMLLGSSAFATQIRADVSSLRVLLLTLFFGAAGMVADPIWIIKNWYIVGGVTAGVVIGKMAIIWMIFRLLGHSSRVAAATALCLAQIGEFAFVLGSIGRSGDVISEELYALVVSVAIVSFFLSAFLVPAAPRLGDKLSRLFGNPPTEPSDDEAQSPAPDVVIIGFGPAGLLAAQPLVDAGKRVVVVDLNREGTRKAQSVGFKGEVGDATQPDVLEHLSLEHVSVVVITVPHHASALAIVEQVRQIAPHAQMIVRSRYQKHSESFANAGAHLVVGDEEQVGHRLAAHLREWLHSTEKAMKS